MNTYAQFKELSLTRKRKLANHTYLVIREDGGFGIKLHDTEVVIHYPTKIVLNSGGWKTVTTKARINEFSTTNLTQSKGAWSVNGVPFADGITIYNSGYITGKGEPTEKAVSMRKRVNKYAKDYADLLCSGDMDKPGGGDCWCCLMDFGGADHIHSHIKENYFVPSMVNHIVQRVSPFTGDFIARTMRGMDTSDWQRGIAHNQIKRGIQQHVLHELGAVA